MTTDSVPILRDSQYLKYAAASILTKLGQGMQFIAMSWFLYSMTGKASSIGWILIISTLPGLLFSPWIGALVDRSDARAICIGADLLRSATQLGVAIAMYLGVATAAIVYASVFLIAVFDNFFEPAAGAMVRGVVAKERLLAANIVGSMSMQTGLLVGAGFGGLLVAHFGAAPIIFLNALSYAVSAALTAWIRPKLPTHANAVRSGNPSFRSEFRTALAYVASNDYIIWIAVLQMFIYVTVYVCNTLLPAFVERDLGAGAAAFGLIDAAWGGGALLGGLLLSHIVRRIERRRFGIMGLLLLSASLALLLTSHLVAQAVCAYFMLGFLCCSIRINTDTILVSEVDPKVFGKIKSMITMFISYVGIAVYCGVGYLGDHVSVRYIYLALCVAILTGLAMTAISAFGRRKKALI
jgi:MFS family permease